MVRYYTVSGDLKNGYDFEYTFRFAKDAEAKYESITSSGVTYKSLWVFDDDRGDCLIRSEVLTA